MTQSDEKFLNYCFFEDKIINLENFNHPGGNFIKKHINGREIGRFIYGAYPIEACLKNQKPHKHSQYAINLLEQQQLGFVDQQKILIPQKVSQLNIDVNIWQKNQQQQFFITDQISVFYFQNPYFKVEYDLKLKDLGMYFAVSDGETQRNYTVIMCFSKNNIQIVKDIMTLIHQDSFMIDYQKIDNENLLPLVIKNYSDGKLSKKIHSNQQKFQIRGPFGVGFQLNELSHGIHYIFAGGTGVLPFLDLFFYLMNKTYKCHVSSSKEDSCYSLIKNGFQIVFFGSFQNRQSIIGYDIIYSLATLCEISGINWFQAFIRVKQNNLKSSKNLKFFQQKFDYQFVNQNVCNHNLQKVFICGPPVMNYEIPIFLKKSKIPESKIILI